MLQDNIDHIDKKLHIMQEKHTYFLLLVSVFAIVLSIYVTHELSLTFNLVPLGLAVLFWGLSFYIGCKHIQYMHSFLITNHTYLQIKQGTHPDIGNHQEFIYNTSKGIKEAMEKSAEDILKRGRWQFQTLVTGGVFYVA